MTILNLKLTRFSHPGVLLALFGVLLICIEGRSLSWGKQASLWIYSFSLLFLYTMSTLYHSFFKLGVTKVIFQRLDHTAIYFLIAGKSHRMYYSIISVLLRNFLFDSDFNTFWRIRNVHATASNCLPWMGVELHLVNLGMVLRYSWHHYRLILASILQVHVGFVSAHGMGPCSRRTLVPWYG